MRLCVAAEMAARERDRPYRGDTMRTSGPVGGSGGNQDHCDEATEQHEAKEPRDSFSCHHYRTLLYVVTEA